MRFEVVVMPVVEVDRAKDLDRIRQVLTAAIGAIGDLDRAVRVAPSYSEYPQTAVTRPGGARTAVAGAFGDTQPEPARAPSPGRVTRYQLDAGLTANHQHATLTLAHGSDQSVTRSALASTPAQARRLRPAEMTGTHDVPHPKPPVNGQVVATDTTQAAQT
jgi:hypothetical protein